jgi:hypothetical protein
VEDVLVEFDADLVNVDRDRDFDRDLRAEVDLRLELDFELGLIQTELDCRASNLSS